MLRLTDMHVDMRGNMLGIKHVNMLGNIHVSMLGNMHVDVGNMRCRILAGLEVARLFKT